MTFSPSFFQEKPVQITGLSQKEPGIWQKSVNKNPTL